VERREEQQMKNLTRALRREEKEICRFLIPPIFVRPISAARTIRPMPHILVGFRLKLMNIILNIFIGTDEFKSLDK
jgi:hypothetical protein